MPPDVIECFAQGQVSFEHVGRAPPVLSDDCPAGHEPVLFGICQVSPESFDVTSEDDKIKGFNASPVFSDAIDSVTHEKRVLTTTAAHLQYSQTIAQLAANQYSLASVKHHRNPWR
eukprot:1952960-Karenia_brevis.AAC.1